MIKEFASNLDSTEVSIKGRTIRGLLTSGVYTFQFAVEPSYARSDVYNPSRQTLERVFESGPAITSEMNILVGATADGRCPADCFECPFANSVMAAAARAGDSRFAFLAKPVTVSEHLAAINFARELAIKNGLLMSDEKYKVAVLLSGDLGINPHTSLLIRETASLKNCRASKWSTIAAEFNSTTRVLEDFIVGAESAMSINADHSPRLQVSLHSTTPESRHAHVVYQAPHRKINLTPASEIAEAFKRVKKITGQKSSLSFVLHKDSVVDPSEIARLFSPDTTLISYRPVFSSSKPQLPHDELLDLCERTKSLGFEFIYMPPRIDPPELDNLRL